MRRLLTVHEVFTQADNNMFREKLLCNQSIHSSVVQTLNKALEMRDFITGGHAQRIREFSGKVGPVHWAAGAQRHRYAAPGPIP